MIIPFGLRGDIYFIPPESTHLPKFEKLKPVGTIYTTSLNLPARDFSIGFPGVTDRTEWFAIDYTGRFWIEKPGKYAFALTSDDGSRLYIDGRLLINNDGIHPPETRVGVLTLSGGIHNMRLSYFQGPRTQIALVLAVSDTETEWRAFSTDEFKPPPNPQDWKFGNPRDLDDSTDREGGRRKGQKK